MTGRSPVDVVDVLIGQHDRLRLLLDQVPAAPAADRRRLFAELASTLHSHEFGEQVVVYPAACDRTPRGGAVAVACLTEGYRVARAAAELRALGSDHPAFQVMFASLRRAFLHHAAREEREEFPGLRRYVPTERLHRMAHELRDVQAMS
jgi:hypothetical protein